MLLSAASKHLNIGQKDESQKMMRHKPPVPLKLFLPHPEKPFNIRYFYAKKKYHQKHVMLIGGFLAWFNLAVVTA